MLGKLTRVGLFSWLSVLRGAARSRFRGVGSTNTHDGRLGIVDTVQLENETLYVYTGWPNTLFFSMIFLIMFIYGSFYQ